MPPTIPHDAALPKQGETQSQPQAPSAAPPSATPGAGAAASSPAGSAVSYSYVAGAEAKTSALRPVGEPVGIAKILPAEGGAQATSSFQVHGDGRAVQAIVDAIGASDGTAAGAGASTSVSRIGSADAAPVPQRQEALRLDTPAASLATQRIVANISDRSTVETRSPAGTQATAAPVGAGPAQQVAPQAVARPPVARQDADTTESARSSQAAGIGGPAALSTPLAEGMERLSAQTMFARTDSMLLELQALVDAYADLHQMGDSHAATVVEALDDKTLQQLIAQAQGTDLGKARATSRVYVLGTVPQTIIEDHAGAQRYSIFNMAGERLAEFSHKEAHGFAIDLGGGRMGALGVGGYATSFHLLGAHNRTVISALGQAVAPSGAGSGAKRGGAAGKVGPIAGLGGAYNDQGDCAASCFISQGHESAQDAARQPGRCVLCRHQQR